MRNQAAPSSAAAAIAAPSAQPAAAGSSRDTMQPGAPAPSPAPSPDAPWRVEVAPDGTVSEPVSGTFSCTCLPEGGGAGIQAALDACPEGGSILLSEGVFAVDCRLLIRRSIHLFGRGVAELKGRVRGSHGIIHVSAPEATLDWIRIDNADPQAWAVGVEGPGRTRFQSCEISNAPGGADVVVAYGSSFTRCDLAGCTVRGGRVGIGYREGATGRVEACNVSGCSKAGICVEGPGTSPSVGRKTVIRDCKVGVLIGRSADAGWTLGTDTAVACCPGGKVEDRRASVGAKGGDNGPPPAPPVAGAGAAPLPAPRTRPSAPTSGPAPPAFVGHPSGESTGDLKCDVVENDLSIAQAETRDFISSRWPHGFPPHLDHEAFFSAYESLFPHLSYKGRVRIYVQLNDSRFYHGGVHVTLSPLLHSTPSYDVRAPADSTPPCIRKRVPNRNFPPQCSIRRPFC